MKVPLSVVDFLRRAEQVYGDRVALVDEPDQPASPWPTLTYREVAERARGRGRRCVLQQHARAPVEITAVEDAAIEGEFPLDPVHTHGGETRLGIAR